ncbi:DNA-3-methyladenine glycosylase II [Lewinella marina]|uniref:DNA-3-methyladenine glycosylase II n=1 Tax=Neolewinella marina TaxID=438751 RepID=A0A2G0CCV7_9BACT|nr:DNA-3-methyladenine glycosylase [Neolewinella marina]NJB86991.1 DNA-3-methyladenine glycosylase II [Neolewinella marina]PHK97814.1 Fe-S cluster assembly protein HesB [Neolewinella marina]
MTDPAIIEHLSREPRIAPIVARHTLKERPDFDGDVYFGLLRSITFQQLSGRAAATIFGRFLDVFPDGYPHPRPLLDLSVADLRAVGMSRSKAAYLHNVAEFWLEHKLINQDWSAYSDEEIIHLLTQIKGVGKWTVEMVLMFVLHRPDLLPLDDLVVRRNLIRLFDLHHLKGKALLRAMIEAAEPWRPYRSYASRFLWEMEVSSSD